MYCKHCGKTIEENSIFCKYCGENVSCDAVQNQRRLIRHFGNLSRRKQTAIIIYGIWFLVWMCFLIDDPNDYAVAFFVFNVVIPFMIIGIWHICKIYKGKKGKGDKKKKERKKRKKRKCSYGHP